jgi:hypothetical protein
MTKLTKRRPSTWWETDCAHWSAGVRRPIVVAVDQRGVFLRLKGEHRDWRIPWNVALVVAIQINNATVKKGP